MNLVSIRGVKGIKEINNVNEVNGINETYLDKLIIDIGNLSDEINNTLNLIDEEIYTALEFFDCSVGIHFKNSYIDFQNNHKLVNSNILSYGTDYSRVKSSYISRGLSIVKQINNIETKNSLFYEEENK